MKHLMLSLVLLFGCTTGQVVKDLVGGAELILCVDNEIEAGSSADQIVAKCGPDAAKVLEQRRVLAAKRRAPCTIITVDAGVPAGPGR